jgi:hypothetical protein
MYTPNTEIYDRSLSLVDTVTIPSGEPAFAPGLSEVRIARSLVFCEVFCKLLFVLLILITPLVG